MLAHHRQRFTQPAARIIDIDFPDKKRHEVFEYLVRKYGRNKVRALGTVNRLMPKSAIGEFAQGLGIPKYETEDVKGAIIERSSGDARAAMCIDDQRMRLFCR